MGIAEYIESRVIGQISLSLVAYAFAGELDTCTRTLRKAQTPGVKGRTGKDLRDWVCWKVPVAMTLNERLSCNDRSYSLQMGQGFS